MNITKHQEYIKLDQYSKNYFSPVEWQLAHNKSIELGSISRVMGILNVTPDSFSDGGNYLDVEKAVDHTASMIKEGADMIDVGGESTRPGGEPIGEDEEQERVIPVIEALVERFDTVISVDTYKSSTANLAVEAGANIINDVGGLQLDSKMASVVAKNNAGVCIMHSSRERKVHPDAMTDQKKYLSDSLIIAEKNGVNRSQIVIDPGLGFGKEEADENYVILKEIGKLHELGFPILIGASRKRLTAAVLGENDTAHNRDIVTSATSTITRMAGCAIFRVHDVGINKHVLKLTDEVINS